MKKKGYGYTLGAYVVIMSEKFENGDLTEEEYHRLTEKLGDWLDVAEERGLIET